MNILVILKQTFDTEEKIEIENGTILENGVNYIVNPYDEYAIEEAVSIVENLGGEVTVLSVGPSRVESALRTALAMGANKAILVEDESLFGDEHTISKVLAAVAKREQYDLILGGYMSVDSGASQVGSRLAEELNIPHIITATKLTINGNKAIVEKDLEGDKEIIEVELPVLITAQQGLNEPRYPSLPNVMKAKKKPLERLSANDLNFDPASIQAMTEVVDQYLAPKKEAGKILQGSLADQARELAHLLKGV